ncbi:MAG: hypothetical protein IT186_02610 [Acidobacteria bacterium]|nr:hypothetical protein [Acidobacteriota bacterium]MCG3193355.1 hypothetical protein [Thermoanaerobaculia bacterium]
MTSHPPSTAIARVGAALAAALLTPAALGASTEPPLSGPVVSLALPDYDALRRSVEVPAIATVETLKLRGRLSDNSLTIEIRGRRLGNLVKLPLLKPPDGISFLGCTGNAFLSSEKESLQLVLSGDPFSLTCGLSVREKTRVELALLTRVLGVRSEVSDAELVRRDSPDSGPVLILTALDAHSGTGPRAATGSGRYRLSVQPGQTVFDYSLAIENPNRSKMTYAVSLPNGEAVQVVTTPCSYSETPGGLSFELVPGANPIRVTGTLPGDQFRPLLPSDEQYLVLENHPMLALTIDSKARRISPKETGIATGARGSLGFLLAPGESVRFSTQKMHVFSSVGYSVPALRYTVFFPSVGHPIVEAHLTLENMGSPQLALDVPGRPTYLDVDGEPQLLYRDSAGRLTVPLGMGPQTLTLQWEAPPDLGNLGDTAAVSLLRLDSPVTHTSVALRSHPKWGVAGASFSRYVFFPLNVAGFLLRVALCAGCAVLFIWLGLGKIRSMFAGSGFLILSVASPVWLAVPALLLGLFASRRFGSRYPVVRRSVTVMTAVFVAVLIGLAIAGTMSTGSRAPEDLLSGAQSGGSASNMPGTKLGKEAGVAEGFPARITLPGRLVDDIRFSEMMVPAGKSHLVRCLLLPAFAREAMVWVVVLGFTLWGFRNRGELGGLVAKSRGLSETQSV